MLRIVLSLILLLHGLIHFLGLAKAFHLAEINQLTQPISKAGGLLWGISGLLFIVTALLYLAKIEHWWVFAIPAVLISQALIFGAWQDAKFGSFVNVVALAGAVLTIGTNHYYNIFQTAAKEGLSRTASIQQDLLTEEDLLQLPAPVQRYLRYQGAVGKPKVHDFKVEFEGQIRKDDQSEWMTFTSEQYNFMDKPTRLFFMKATMKGLPVAGYHAYKNGAAMMDIRLLSLLKVQYKDGKEMDMAETVTFFNDMCCLAPATLIDPRIKWLESDEHKVKAQFTNNGITITAWLFFNETGQLVNFISNDRYAVGKGGNMEQLPWSTPLRDYRVINGHRLAGAADAIYGYASGDLTYGVFKTTNIMYNCSSQDQASEP